MFATFVKSFQSVPLNWLLRRLLAFWTKWEYSMKYYSKIIPKKRSRFQMNEKSVVVAVDGSVYRFHPHFHNLMTETIEQLVHPDIQVFHFLLKYFMWIKNFKCFLLWFSLIWCCQRMEVGEVRHWWLQWLPERVGEDLSILSILAVIIFRLNLKDCFPK